MMRQISHEMLDGSLNSKAPNITRGMGIAIRSNRSQYVPLMRLDSMELMDAKMPETRHRQFRASGSGTGSKLRGAACAHFFFAGFLPELEDDLFGVVLTERCSFCSLCVSAR
jgi:hypothetical protein